MDSPTLTYILLGASFIIILAMVIFVSLDTKKVNKECKILDEEIKELKRQNNENSINSNYPSYID